MAQSQKTYTVFYSGWPLSSHCQIPWLFPDFSRHVGWIFMEYRPSQH